MKNISWQRALIALLLMLNAIPFSYGPKFSPNIGILWAVAGWFILSWPILAESFCGPADGSRKFGLFDRIKVALSAVFLFFVVFFPVMILWPGSFSCFAALRFSLSPPFRIGYSPRSRRPPFTIWSAWRIWATVRTRLTRIWR